MVDKVLNQRKICQNSIFVTLMKRKRKERLLKRDGRERTVFNVKVVQRHVSERELSLIPISEPTRPLYI